jgi:hypothetical protein
MNKKRGKGALTGGKVGRQFGVMFRSSRAVFLSIIAAAVILAGGIPARAASFKTDWNTALQSAPAANSIVGAWEGEWKSKAHHVSGPLRCVITDLGNGKYQARFHAQFHWFHFTYTAQLVSEKTAQGAMLKGEADLGWMGGVYKYSGPVSPTKYVSTYASPVENGVLELARPQKA